MAVSTSEMHGIAGSRSADLYSNLNTRWHKPALLTLLAVVILHWGEHLFQAYQVYVLNWAMPQALGMLGMLYPWLVRSETLHYGYALVMLVGLWALRGGFSGRGRTWWMIAFGLQFWHHIEHGLLLYQAATGHYLFGGGMPMSIGQIWIPRMELHLLYNSVVFVPMLIGMYYHMYPPVGEAPVVSCSCARHRQAVAPAMLQAR